ncbi:hypothetical protein [Deinococcus cellulosilyticus]|uniref:Uncharacterized protein n=1 Tax=Deinococcus cellulosilyticus (strain DSM 18568 / NBRC 106333 / KACC 11606 / 5516J-15) TaxID=1223518 RepID=A0A511N9X9_DEIC1|nr:hypothetical protein [Deinococcus cellulosilyticus]GEM49633.1 hypothetical protein DC3_52680 [Deinococcus cellulosilyticus NBRC 106333 = KACC 11606]
MIYLQQAHTPRTIVQDMPSRRYDKAFPCIASLDDGIIVLTPIYTMYNHFECQWVNEIYMVAQSFQPYTFSREELELLYRGIHLEIEVPLRAGDVVMHDQEELEYYVWFHETMHTVRLTPLVRFLKTVNWEDMSLLLLALAGLVLTVLKTSQ